MSEIITEDSLLVRMREALETVHDQDKEELVIAVESLARKLRYRTTQEGEQ